MTIIGRHLHQPADAHFTCRRANTSCQADRKAAVDRSSCCRRPQIGQNTCLFLFFFKRCVDRSLVVTKSICSTRRSDTYSALGRLFLGSHCPPRMHVYATLRNGRTHLKREINCVAKVSGAIYYKESELQHVDYGPRDGKRAACFSPANVTRLG